MNYGIPEEVRNKDTSNNMCGNANGEDIERDKRRVRGRRSLRKGFELLKERICVFSHSLAGHTCLLQYKEGRDEFESRWGGV